MPESRRYRGDIGEISACLRGRAFLVRARVKANPNPNPDPNSNLNPNPNPNPNPIPSLRAGAFAQRPRSRE